MATATVLDHWAVHDRWGVVELRNLEKHDRLFAVTTVLNRLTLVNSVKNVFKW